LGGPTADLINTSLRGARLTLENDGAGPGTLKFATSGAKVLLGKATGGLALTGDLTNLKFGEKDVAATGLALADVQVVTSDNKKYAVQLGGANAGSLAAKTNDPVVIDNSTEVKGE
jgi:hypothetical protein